MRDEAPQPLAEPGAMVAAMAPVLVPGRFAFRTVAGGAAPPDAIGTFREAEGLSVIVPAEAGDAPVLRQITLGVHSALEAVGLTAAVSGALAAEGIACNVVAARHHDHLFVPEADAERALAALRRLAAAQG